MCRKGSSNARLRPGCLQFRPDAYNFGVGQLNGLGATCFATAIPRTPFASFSSMRRRILRWPTFDALGDAYEKDGNRALAISNYEKAQQLDPKLAHAADALKRLKN